MLSIEWHKPVWLQARVPHYLMQLALIGVETRCHSWLGSLSFVIFPWVIHRVFLFGRQLFGDQVLNIIRALRWLELFMLFFFLLIRFLILVLVGAISVFSIRTEFRWLRSLFHWLSRKCVGKNNGRSYVSPMRLGGWGIRTHKYPSTKAVWFKTSRWKAQVQQ